MHAPSGFALEIAAAAVLCAGCRSGELVAHRADRAIHVDGDPSEWGELIVEVKDAGYDLGYANDDEFLYLCLITDGADVRRQVLAGGVHVWFDPAGGEGRVVGLRYPVGLDAARPEPVGGPPTEEEREQMPARFEGLAAGSLDRVEFLDATGETRAVAIGELRGIEVGGLLTSGALSLEMKIPLRALEGVDLALGMDPGAAAVGVEFYVPAMQAPERPRDGSGGRRGGGGMPGGGMPGGGMGGGMPGGMRGGGPGGGFSGSKAIREHVVIPLAR